jgi:hypothetical protein
MLTSFGHGILIRTNISNDCFNVKGYIPETPTPDSDFFNKSGGFWQRKMISKFNKLYYVYFAYEWQISCIDTPLKGSFKSGKTHHETDIEISQP